MDKYMIPRKTDAKAPPAPVSLDIASLLPSLENTKVALFRTWGKVLNNQLIVTGAHCWVPSTLGSVLFVTVFDSYVETVLKVCIDRILLHYKKMGVKVVKAGESYIDRADKRVTESPTYNPYLFKFGHAMCLPISATTVLASELIEGWAIDYLREVFVCANQRSERAGSYGGTRVQGICRERPASFYLNPLQTFIATYADYLREKDNTHMIQLAQTRLCNFGSVDILPFLEMRTPAVKSNVAIDLTDDVDINEISDDDVGILGMRESVKSDESSDADLHSKLQEMFTGEALDEILSSEKQTCLNTIIKHFRKDRLGSFADLDQERYMSFKKGYNIACPGLILSNHTSNRYGEVVGTFRSLNDLTVIVGLKGKRRGQVTCPTVKDLRNAGFDGVKFRNDHLVVRLIQPADTMSLEQVIADCANDSGKKATLEKLVNLASTELLAKKRSIFEVHGHVKIVCKAMYKDPPHSHIFNIGTSSFIMTYLSGKDRLFHIPQGSREFGNLVADGGAMGASFPSTSVRQGECKGKQYPAFSAFIVSATSGEDLTEEEHAQLLRKKSKK
jgi:hypothetical protein